jgi:FlaA1/EpsC-like NDP-sugar epimerase
MTVPVPLNPLAGHSGASMEPNDISRAYDFTGRTIAITGGGGVLCSELARVLAACNANVVILDRDVGRATKKLDTLGGTKG